MPHGQIISPVLTDAGSVQDFGPGGVLNQLPGLKATGDAQRLALTVMNEYKDNNGDRYNAQHPNAVSDGDGHGRGEDSGQVGTREDQLAVQTALYSSGNKYKPGMGYDNFNYPQQYW
jgi:hypothetical protein